MDNRIDNAPLSEVDKGILRDLIINDDSDVASTAVLEYVTIVENVIKTPEVLHKNVVDTQLDIIRKSAKIYNFVDFL